MSILITGVDERSIICRAGELKGLDPFDTNPQVYVCAGNIKKADYIDNVLKAIDTDLMEYVHVNFCDANWMVKTDGNCNLQLVRNHNKVEDSGIKKIRKNSNYTKPKKRRKKK